LSFPVVERRARYAAARAAGTGSPANGTPGPVNGGNQGMACTRE
jgi:hypothetical protein